MVLYLIDANLPYYFRLWNTPEYVHQLDINPKSKDHEIWEYAKLNKLTIITKDSDFMTKVLLFNSPPKVIHVRTGNIDMKKFFSIINACWNDVLIMSQTHKLVTMFSDHIEAIK